MQPWTEALLKRLTSGSVHAGEALVGGRVAISKDLLSDWRPIACLYLT